jgi:hypothetical protein
MERTSCETQRPNAKYKVCLVGFMFYSYYANQIENQGMSPASNTLLKASKAFFEEVLVHHLEELVLTPSPAPITDNRQKS